MAKRVRKRRSIKLPEPEFLPAIDKWAKKWKPEFVRHVFYLSLLGANDVQISQALGVQRSVIDSWKRKKPEFLEAMNKGKLMADAKVSHSLYLAAIGYSHPDKVVLSNRVRKYNDKGVCIHEHTEPLIVDTVKNYPPNVTAAIKWLQARQPQQWGNKLEIKGKVDHTHKLDLSQFSEEELEVIKKLGIQSRNLNVEDADYEDFE